MPRRLMLMICLLIALIAGAGGGALWVQAHERTVIGRVENVILDDVNDMKLKARIDTGAGLSSLNAHILEIIPADKTDNGSEQVRFEITDESGHKRILKRTIVEWVNIKNKGHVEGFSRRPVIITDVCLGGKRVEGRVNLADRSSFLYPALIGRNLLKAGDFLIDPEQKFTHHSSCPQSKSHRK